MRPCLLALGFLLALPATAQTCLRRCQTPKLIASDVTDEAIRAVMKQCRDSCEASTLASLPGPLASRLKACDPEAVSEADMKRVRSASPSPLAYAGAFVWDVHNVLEGRYIRRVELVTQNLALQDVVLSSRGTVPPGDTQTILISAANDGYPAVAVTARIKAIYACPGD